MKNVATPHQRILFFSLLDLHYKKNYAQLLLLYFECHQYKCCGKLSSLLSHKCLRNILYFVSWPTKPKLFTIWFSQKKLIDLQWKALCKGICIINNKHSHWPRAKPLLQTICLFFLPAIFNLFVDTFNLYNTALFLTDSRERNLLPSWFLSSELQNCEISNVCKSEEKNKN